MRIALPALAILALVDLSLAGCGDSQGASTVAVPPPFVKTARVQASTAAVLGLSGIVRAQIESPLSFQVSGRIIARRVDAGHVVKAGEVLFELDKRDLEQAVLAARANLAAADSALATAQADLNRHRQLLAKQFIGAQAMERVELAEREAKTRSEVAMAQLQQARNAFGYGQLRAPANGVLVDVSGEVGQVVAAGQSVALLAQAGAREVEVHFAEKVSPPATGEVQLGEQRFPLQLREQAGAVDPQGRTLRVRYTITAQAERLQLGAVVRARFHANQASAQDLSVPLAALTERGAGPGVWLFKAGQVTLVPVSVLALDTENAHIRGPLQVGDHVVALGTHLLDEHMRVRELAP